MTTPAGTDYYLTDAQGTVTAVVDNAGNQLAAYTYTPYGAARTTTGTLTQPNQYTGAYLDPTGLYHLGARSYDPTLGRYTQPDPSGKETNPYAYTADDPINHTDPTGRSILGDIVGAVLITVAVVAVGALLSTGFGEIAAGELLFGSADIAAAGPIGTGLTFGGYYSITGT